MREYQREKSILAACDEIEFVERLFSIEMYIWILICQMSE